jgi:hypothetical protein
MGIVMEAEGASIIEAAEREWKRHRFVETRDARVAEQLEIKSGPEVAELARTAEQCKTYLDGGQGKNDGITSPTGEIARRAEHTRAREPAECEETPPKKRARRARASQKRRRAQHRRRDKQNLLPAPPLRRVRGAMDTDDSDMEGVADGRTNTGGEVGEAHGAGEAEGGGVGEWPGLKAPKLNNGNTIDGANKRQLRRENKRKRQEKQLQQEESTYWSTYKGQQTMPEQKESPKRWRGDMCPKNLALHHPAAEKLLSYATGGCPTNTGKPWTKQQIWEAVARGPHSSALIPEAMEQLEKEVREKAEIGQCRIVAWDDIKDNPPEQMKVSPVAMIPHKSRAFRAILDLSFSLRLSNREVLRSVNESTTLSAPAGAIDQLGHSLMRIIHAFAEAEPEDKVFSAKWDIKDGFWRMQCKEGEEWNFSYVLPQPEGMPVLIVVPASLQMGWVESPPYFCAASETARDVAATYAEMPMGSLLEHKFESYTTGSEAFSKLPREIEDPQQLRYLVEVYVDDFIALAIPTSQQQLVHVGRGVLHGIHDIFPADDVDENDPTSLKKLKKNEGRWDLNKELLGFDFDGDEKTMILGEGKLQLLLATMQKWIRASRRGQGGIPFAEFESTLCRLRHAFIALPAGRGFFTAAHKLLSVRPPVVYLKRNKSLLVCMDDCRRLLRESASAPTPCRELVMGEPDYIGIKDASIHGVGGVVVGDNKACIPTVFRLEWPQDIRDEVLKTNAGKKGKLTNSDLECAGLLLLWLVMEVVCCFEPGDHTGLFSDNSPTVSWVRRMAARGSLVAEHLLRALALRLKQKRVSPLTPLHIEGKKNALTDVPSRSFGSKPAWFCKNDDELLTLFNNMFPLPQQNSWTVFRLTSNISMRVISLLRMQIFSMDELRRLPKIGQHVGRIGAPTSGLWEWTLTFRESHTSDGPEPSPASLQESEMEDMVRAERLRVTQYRRLSRPLDRRSTWCAE